MMVGVPCVASYAGGIPSLLQHECSGLLFSPGDAYSLAGMIARLFREPALAKKLATNARITAQERHDPQRIAKEIGNIYSSIIGGSKMNDLAWAYRRQENYYQCE